MSWTFLKDLLIFVKHFFHFYDTFYPSSEYLITGELIYPSSEYYIFYQILTTIMLIIYYYIISVRFHSSKPVV